MSAGFLTKLSGDWIDDKRFILTSDLIYDSDVLNQRLVVPCGFETDFASVPRVPFVYTLFGDRAHHESVVHDYLYHILPHICTRKQADEVFLEAMKARGKSWFIRRAMYAGVRIGGRRSWK